MHIAGITRINLAFLRLHLRRSDFVALLDWSEEGPSNASSDALPSTHPRVALFQTLVESEHLKHE